MSEEMSPNPRHLRCGGRGLFGPLILIALGVIFLLDQLHIVQAGYVFQYFWPAVFIIFGIEILTFRPQGARTFWGVLAIIVGAGWIGSNMGYWYLNLANWWPLILIAAGIGLLFRRTWAHGERSWQYYRPRRRYAWAGDSGEAASTRPGAREEAGATESAGGGSTTEEKLEGFAIFGGYQRRINSQQFRGGHVEAIFGGVQIDLRRAEIDGNEARVDVSAVFGGVELRVPERWIIEMRGQPLLGGFSDETHQDMPQPGAKRLIITGFAMFGGVVVKN
ncbi:MAG: LiaI-LiaF-like domain-containing protein [Terriglobales bacterium]